MNIYDTKNAIPKHGDGNYEVAIAEDGTCYIFHCGEDDVIAEYDNMEALKADYIVF